MQEDIVKRLVRAKTLLTVAIFILVLAEFSFILFQVFDFLWAAIGAVIVLLLRLGFYIFKDKNGWEQKLLLGLAIIGVFGPVIYYIYKILFVDHSSLWLMIFLTASFLLPVAIMFYVNRLLIKLIAQPDID
ncbi:MAG: hypothetical protein OXE99_12190 [Cellvibrionales bacterium]|nr:hypothetical protein [Cellvibrionales bacterium]